MPNSNVETSELSDPPSEMPNELRMFKQNLVKAKMPDSVSNEAPAA